LETLLFGHENALLKSLCGEEIVPPIKQLGGGILSNQSCKEVLGSLLDKAV
jgi:hypothetical protein